MYISLSDKHYSWMHTDCLIMKQTFPHTHSIQETFLSSGTKPESLYNLFLTVWSTKLQQMFIVLQTAGFNSYALLEAFL